MNKSRSAYFDGVKYDDLIFVCSSVVGVARMVRQPEKYVVGCLREDGVRLELETAQVNHCGAPEIYYRELIEDYGLETGTYDVRTYLDSDTRLPDDRYMGSIYARLIVDLMEERREPLISIFMEVFASELPDCLNDFRMAYYFMPSNQLLAEYLEGEFDRIEGKA